MQRTIFEMKWSKKQNIYIQLKIYISCPRSQFPIKTSKNKQTPPSKKHKQKTHTQTKTKPKPYSILMNTGYKIREKRFTIPQDLGLCITSNSYKSKQKTGFGEKEQKNKQTFIYIKKKKKPTQKSPIILQKIKQTPKPLKNYSTSHCLDRQ